MKKLLSLTAIFLVFLCGCTTEPAEVKINRCFSAKAQIQYQSTAFTADFTSDENGCSAVFSSPESINGLTVSYNGSEFTYSLNELTFTAPSKKEEQSFLRLFYEAVRNTAAVTTANESGYTVEGSIPAGSYYLNINKEQLTPVFFEIEEIGLTVSFG